MMRAVLFAATLLTTSLFADSLPGSGVPVTVVITAQPHKNEPPAKLTPDDVLVTQNKRHMPVTSLEPLSSQQTVQLWILLDDGSSSSLSAQLGDLRKFIVAQRPTAEIGIGYMRNGMVEVVQPLTADHESAAKALRLTTATPGISASPYQALQELVKKWPAGAAAREVLMITSGIDPDYGEGPDNPYLDQAEHAAQRAGIVVYTIYYSAAGRIGRAGGERFWGQNYMSQLGGDTGGFFYWIGDRNPVSLSPYLDDFDHRLNNQYLLTFLAQPEDKPGLQSVKVSNEHPHITVTGPNKVYVPLGK
jgi:hypothetical protein